MIKIELQYVETLVSALNDSIEYAICFDGTSGYGLIGDDILFKTEKEAMDYALKNDEDFKRVKNLNMLDKVVPVYDDDEFLYYISEQEAIK